MEGGTMVQVLHGSATTTEAIRRAIRNSEESLRALSARYGINQKTVAKWRKRTSITDLPTGPKDAKSGLLPTFTGKFANVQYRTLLPRSGSPIITVVEVARAGPHSNTRFQAFAKKQE
jgi:hypothetical protein